MSSNGAKDYCQYKYIEHMYIKILLIGERVFC